MDVTIKIEEVSPVKKKLTFEIPWERVKKELDFAYVKVGKQARVKGFRPGKTPRKILETYYKDQAEGEAISSLVNDNYWDAIEKNNITPASQPVVDQQGITPEADFVFSATVETRPVIDPQGYLGLELEKEEAVVTDEAVNSKIDELRNMYSTVEDIVEDRAVQEGDFVSIDFQGSVDGKALDSMKADNYLLEIGSGRFIPGFEKELVGLKKDQEKEFPITFPTEYGAKDVAGKEAVFKVTVKAIKMKRTPDLDEEFMKNFERFESIEALKTNIREAIEEEQKAMVASAFTRKMLDNLLEKNVFEVPESLVDRQLYMMIMNYQQQMARSGVDPQKAAELSYRMKDNMKGEAERQVKIGLLLDAIAAREGITADEQDLEERIRLMAARFGRDVDSVKKACEKDDMVDSLKAEIIEQKTIQFIEEKASIKMVKPENAQKEG